MRLDNIVEKLDKHQRILVGQVWAEAYDSYREQLDLFPDNTQDRYRARMYAYSVAAAYARELR